jgi:hypothetical protein
VCQKGLHDGQVALLARVMHCRIAVLRGEERAAQALRECSKCIRSLLLGRSACCTPAVPPLPLSTSPASTPCGSWLCVCRLATSGLCYSTATLRASHLVQRHVRVGASGQQLLDDTHVTPIGSPNQRRRSIL